MDRLGQLDSSNNSRHVFISCICAKCCIITFSLAILTPNSSFLMILQNYTSAFILDVVRTLPFDTLNFYVNSTSRLTSRRTSGKSHYRFSGPQVSTLSQVYQQYRDRTCFSINTTKTKEREEYTTETRMTDQQREEKASSKETMHYTLDRSQNKQHQKPVSNN